MLGGASAAPSRQQREPLPSSFPAAAAAAAAAHARLTGAYLAEREWQGRRILEVLGE